jgi:hypothetical protein
MHRVTMWIALTVSAIGMVICYQINASGLTYNPATPDNNPNGSVNNVENK